MSKPYDPMRPLAFSSGAAIGSAGTAAPTLAEVQVALRDATDGLCSNSATLRDLSGRLFGNAPPSGVDAMVQPSGHGGEVGSLLDTARVLLDLLRDQRAIIDRLVAI